MRLSCFKSAVPLLMCAALAPIASAEAQRQPAVPEIDSARRARALLESAIHALGGEQAVRDLGVISRRMMVHYVDTGQQAQPWRGAPDPDPSALPIGLKIDTVSTIDYRGSRIFKSERFEDAPDDWYIHRESGDSSGGFETGAFREATPFFRRYSAADVRSLMEREARQFPEAILLDALDRPDTLRLVGRGDFHGRSADALSFAARSGAVTTLYLDSGTNLLLGTRGLRAHPLLGDTTSEVTFSDYRPVAGVKLPYRYQLRVDGIPTRDVIVREVRANPGADAFVHSRPSTSVAIQQSPESATLRPAGHGVYEILGPYNLMFAVFRDWVLLVEAPQDEAYARTAFDMIRSVAPGKPVRLVATHFHFDHLGGVRYAIAQGSQIWTTPDAAEVLRSLLGRRFTFRPDSLAGAPRDPVIHEIRKIVFDDGTQRVDILDIGPTEHSRQILAAYFPRTRTLHVADLWDLLSPELALGSRDSERMLDRAVSAGFDFIRFVPMHGIPASRAQLHRGMEVRWRFVKPLAGSRASARPVRLRRTGGH